MASRKRPFTGRLLKPIDLGEVKSRGLTAAFALPPSDDDIQAHIDDELNARWTELDEFFGLNSNAIDIWQQRARVINRREFGVEPDDPDWWGTLTRAMCYRYVPGFSFKLPRARKRGAPVEWGSAQLAQLFADVEYRKKKTRQSIRAICKWLPKSKAYAQRWGKYGPAALRKAYSEAVKRRRHLLFEIELCGSLALIATNRADRIQAAIERHALKVP
jgi:hypothetical protein